MIIHANRIEVIDHTNTRDGFERQFVKREDTNFRIEIAFQDGNRTVKIFLDDLEKVQKPEKTDMPIVKMLQPIQLAG